MLCLHCRDGIAKGQHTYCKVCWLAYVWEKQNYICPVCKGVYDESAKVEYSAYSYTNPNSAIVVCWKCYKFLKKEGTVDVAKKEDRHIRGHRGRTLEDVAVDMGATPEQLQEIMHKLDEAMWFYVMKRHNGDVHAKTHSSTRSRKFYNICREVLGDTEAVWNYTPKQHRSKKGLGQAAIKRGSTAKGVALACDRCGDVGPYGGTVKDYPDPGTISRLCKECYAVFG